ncbi:hypothetical protein [Sneathiella glossodoripedis]|uniref:hypothetical protein n=1 Tax=Sneathiella glossodoripedis TaxID=418853 RepID=UPI000B075146|nr:hypothetical protein [Sneathiella glossodoripedis]
MGQGSVGAAVQAEFVAPSAGSDVVRIKLPEDIDILTLTTLAVELDAIDVTAILSLDGTDFVLKPLKPFAAGIHQVRLLDITNAENPVELGSWIFEIHGGSSSNAGALADLPDETELSRAEAMLTSGSIRFDSLTETSLRLAERNITNAPDKGILSGAGDFNANLEVGKLQLQSRANYFLQTDNDKSLTGNALDLGEYELSLNYSGEDLALGATLGHHDIGVQSLTMSGFYRRGASVQIGDAAGHVRAKAFSLGTESIAGGENFSGLNNGDERISGGSLTVQPFSLEPGALKITGIFYDGKGAGIGDGIMVTEPVAEGRGWSAIVEKSFADQRIVARGEYAHSIYDQDGDAGSAPTKDSDAISISLDLRPFASPPIWLGDTADISLGVSYNRLGTYFQSLANAGVAADREAYALYGSMNWGKSSSNLQYIYETNNVDGLEAVATDYLHNLSFSTNYAMEPFEGAMSWLGTPSVYLSGFVADAGRLDTPSGYLGPGTNNLTKSLTLGGNTSVGNWSWGVSHTISSYEDFTNTSSDTLNNGTAFNVNWTDFDRFNFGGAIQFNVFEDLDENTSNFGTNIGVDVSAAIIRDILDLNLDYNLNLSAGSGDQPDTHLVNGEIEWTFLQAEPNNPGMALALGGSMESSNGNADSADDETIYQVFLVFRVKAPFAYDY